MRCAHARELMSEALDGEVRPPGRERLSRHLEQCEACRAEMARLEQVHALFAGAKRFEPRAGLALRVFAAARQPERSHPWLFPAPVRALARVAAFTAVVAIGVVSGTLLSGSFDQAGGLSSSALPSLEIFAAAPPDSPGGAYLAMLGAEHD